MSRTAYKLRESFGVSGGRHDPEKGIVYGVKVLGLKSRNGRNYAPQAARAAIPMIESRAVYVDHPDEKPNPVKQPARSITSRFARLRGLQPDQSGDLYGDLHYRTKHWFTEQFRDIVDNDPMGVGLSINAHGFGTPQSDGTVLVDEITRVYSVDLVDDPATCAGLWEQAMPDPLDAGAGLGTDGGDWRAQVGELLKSIAMDSSLDKAAMRSKVMQALKLLDEPAGDSGTGTEAGADKMMEQLRSIPHPAARYAARRLEEVALRERLETRRKQARDAGLPEIALSEQFVADLAAAPDTKVPALIDDRRKLLSAVNNRPKSFPDVPPGDGDGGKAPDTKDVKKLVEHYFG